MSDHMLWAEARDLCRGRGSGEGLRGGSGRGVGDGGEAGRRVGKGLKPKDFAGILGIC